MCVCVLGLVCVIPEVLHSRRSVDLCGGVRLGDLNAHGSCRRDDRPCCRSFGPPGFVCRTSEGREKESELEGNSKNRRSLSYSAVEALTVIVVVQCLHPTIAGLNGEATSIALGGEELIPIGLAVGIAILQEEGRVAKDLAALAAREALRMEVLANGVQAVALRRRERRILEKKAREIGERIKSNSRDHLW